MKYISSFKIKEVIKILSLILIGCLINRVDAAISVTGLNFGFNDTTAWLTNNDAVLGHTGGINSWSWNTPLVQTTVVNSIETVLPTEGIGFALTYAGGDRYSQSLFFGGSGTFLIQLDVLAISGPVDFLRSGVPTTESLGNGQFMLSLGSLSSPIFEAEAGNGWQTITWLQTVNSGAQAFLSRIH